MSILQGMKKHSIIILIILVVIVVFSDLWIGGRLYPHQTSKNLEEIRNMTEEQLPDDVKKEIETIKMSYDYTFGISKWDFDFKNNQVVIYAFDIHDEKQVKDLQNTKINKWTFKVVHDVDTENERKQAWAEAMELEKNPELQIGGVDLGRDEITMWVFNLTPENQALDGKVIHGRTIHIALDVAHSPQWLRNHSNISQT